MPYPPMFCSIGVPFVWLVVRDSCTNLYYCSFFTSSIGKPEP